jgi:hypothetical protein
MLKKTLNRERTKRSDKSEYYFCENCDFKCCKKGGYERHITTLKHKKYVSLTKSGNPLTEKEPTKQFTPLKI